MVNIGNGDIISAQPGQDSQADYHGGDGYSGGGGGGEVADGSQGGSDGSDGAEGADGPGGSGTGEDMSLYVFDAWLRGQGYGGGGCNGGNWQQGLILVETTSSSS